MVSHIRAKPDLAAVTAIVNRRQSNMVPVYHEIRADLLTPVAAYLRLAQNQRQSFLLESVSGGENISRFSFLGAGDFRTLKTHDEDGDPLGVLEKELSLVKYERLPGVEFFTGGAIGYISYDCVRFFEPHTARVEIEDTLKLPNATLMFVDDIVVFDHLRHSIIIVSHMRITDDIKNDAHISQEYERTIDRINQIQAILDIETTPLPPQPPIEMGHEAVSNVGKDGYENFVKSLKTNIKAGDVIQTVPSQRFTKRTTLHPFNAYRQLRSVNPSPYMFYIDVEDFQIVGASPEMLVKVDDDGKVHTNPIAGTIKRGKTQEEDDALAEQLLGDLKERSEHLMLVDLGRNDINRVCEANTVKVDSLMHIERYSHVMHIVSNVSGRLREGKTRFDAFRSVFPAGTVSGAPKVKAMELIYSMEKDKRGIYAGAVGTFSYNNSINTGIAIRTMLFKDGNVYLQAGGGIVYDSDPVFEYYETVNKLKANVKAIEAAEFYHKMEQSSSSIEGAKKSTTNGKKRKLEETSKCPIVSRGDFTKLSAIKESTEGKKVQKKSATGLTVLIDNYDSFTFNVYQYLSQLGANLVVFRNDTVTVKDIIKLNPRNIVISPGPGHPRDAAVSNDVIKYFGGKVPVLGICLGEQCMYEIYGGTVTFAGEIVHGKTTPVQHDGRGLFKGLPQEIHCTRYHSLAGDKKTLPNELEITSTTRSGIVMGVRHKKYVMEGVQFHPESVGSEHGLALLSNFLRWEGGTWDSLVINDKHVKPVKESEEDLKLAKRSQIGKGLSLTDIIKLNAVDPGSGEDNSVESTKKGGPTILEKIKAQRLEDVAASKLIPGQSYEQLLMSVKEALYPKKINFADRIREGAQPIAVMAEIKRASPSKNDININAHAATQATTYARGGASVISVLTEPTWFKGSLKDLTEARKAVDHIETRPAILRKDFIVDKYQILEACLAGADSLLLIVAILEDDLLKELFHFSRLLGMEPLVEVANDDEMRRALVVLPDVKVIGVNNRDLHNFKVDMSRTSRLSSFIDGKPDIILAALSGIKSAEDTRAYHDSGASAVLVGEALMKSSNPHELIHELSLRKGRVSQKSNVRGQTIPLKVCGITTVDDAKYLASKGVRMLGLILSASKRKIDVTKAHSIVKSVRETYGHCKISDATTHKVDSHLDGVSVNVNEWFDTHFDILNKRTDKAPVLVGLFHGESIETVNRLSQELDLDYVQLHGDESPEYVKMINIHVIKCIHVFPNDTVESIYKRASSYAGIASAILLDTGKSGASVPGGHGETFDWKVASKLSSTKKLPFIIAGGLTSDNVAKARETFAVGKTCYLDVCSGTELSAGVKDKSKVETFVNALH